MTRLATFVHISDLHIGIPIDNVGDAALNSAWKWSTVFDGLLGHEFRALKEIEKLFRRLRTAEEARLLVTGDLSARGAADELSLCKSFLESEGRFTECIELGLRVGHDHEPFIPGNHDHWPGGFALGKTNIFNSWIFGGPSKEFRTYFPELPWVGETQPLSQGWKLRFVGIDSDADVSPYGKERLLAQGVFLSQLKKLSADLPQLEPKELRVLLVHHSRSHRGRGLSSLEMTKSSRDHLDDFIHEHGFSVLLSGHVHVPHVEGDTLIRNKLSHKFLEARCGTSSVRMEAPYPWERFGRRRRLGRSWPNTLLVHRIFEDNGRPRWETVTHVQTPRGFQAVPPSAGGQLRSSLSVNETYPFSAESELR